MATYLTSSVQELDHSCWIRPAILSDKCAPIDCWCVTYKLDSCLLLMWTLAFPINMKCDNIFQLRDAASLFDGSVSPSSSDIDESVGLPVCLLMHLLSVKPFEEKNQQLVTRCTRVCLNRVNTVHHPGWWVGGIVPASRVNCSKTFPR